MFRDLQRILRATGMPFGDEELLDALWLVSRLPQGTDTFLAAQWAVAQQTTGRPEEHTVAASGAFASGPADHRTPPPREDVPGGRPEDSVPEPLADPSDLAALAGARNTGHSTDLGLRVPGLKALGGDLAFGRALRPLKRRIPSACATEVDEEATAAAQADTRVPQVVLRPQPERWLRLAFVIDSATSMLLWERHCAELLAVFERSGAFRQIEVHQLRYRDPQSPRSITLVRPWNSGDAQALPPHCVTDPSGRTMVIVLTDGAAPAWRDGRMHSVLQDWATAGPTALIHVLPRPLWAGTGITADSWHITTPRPGAPNAHWRVTHPVLPPTLSAFAGVPVPVLELTPPGLASWATALTTVGHPMPLRLWEPRAAAPAPPVVGATASALAFTRTASPQSVRLAAHLAAMAPLTVPVMQLVHSCLPGSNRTATLAEVFLSGLLTPLPPEPQAPADIRHRLFDFTAEAKDLLLDAVPATELLSCSRRVGARMATLVGRSSDFPAWLLTPAQETAPTGGPQPFAYVGQSLLTRVGVATTSPQPSSQGHHAGAGPTVVILTALPLEYDAVRAHLTDVETLVHPSGTHADVGRLPGTPWSVALARVEAGNATAAALTERVISWFSPAALFLVGVAGGLKDDIGIGDVVVATKAYDIHGGMHTFARFFGRPAAWHVPSHVERVARNALLGAEYPVHFKPIAGTVFVPAAESTTVRHLLEHDSDVAAIAIEGGGLTRATYHAGILHTLIIRGISDSLSAGKHAQDPSTAAHHAADAAVAVLRELRPHGARQQDMGGALGSDVSLGSPEPDLRWPDEPSRTRLVMIAGPGDTVSAGSRFDHWGTGFLLGPRLILTAAHILGRPSQAGNVKIRTRQGSVTADGWVDCRLLWSHDDYDAALLLAEEDLAEPSTDSFSLPRWAQLTGTEPLSSSHITGITLKDNAFPQASGHLTGVLYPTSPHSRATYEFEPTLSLTLPRGTQQFVMRGLSGSPVFFGESLLGFVVAMRDDISGSPRLDVVGMSALVTERGFTEVCRQYMRRVPHLDFLLGTPSVPAADDRVRGRSVDRVPPRVFISYAHEDDNGAHAEQVRRLGQLLSAEGIRVRLDQVDAEVPRDWTAWMQQEMDAADVILVIASPAYRRRAEYPEADPSVGVTFEARLLRNELAHPSANESRIVPVFLPGSASTDLPYFLRSLRALVIDPVTGSGTDKLLRRLTQGSPAEDRTDPADQAGRLMALAEHDWHRGNRAGALATAAQAIEVYRRLASNDPVDHRPSLVRALVTQSNRLAETGRFDTALQAAREAVKVSDDPTQSVPGTLRLHFAVALSTLSNRLADLGRHDEALSTSNDAIGICRQVNETSPGTYLPEFATMLNNQGSALRKAGRPTEAVDVIEEAVQVSRRFPRIEPDTLASTLLNLGSALSELGRHEEALITTEEAVAVSRQLAETSPGAPGTRLADALHHLSLRLSETGRWAEALTTIDEAIGMRRHIVATNPDAFLPGLAQSLSAAAWLRTSRRLDLNTALDEAHEAVEIFRRLTAQRPTVFTGDLQRAQSLEAAALNELGRSDEADQDRSRRPSPHRDTTDVRIQTERGDPEELQSLLQQLELEPSLRGQAQLVPVAPKSALGRAALVALEVALPGGQCWFHWFRLLPCG